MGMGLVWVPIPMGTYTCGVSCTHHPSLTRLGNTLYCTILINLSEGVTCDQLDEISRPASQHVTWDKPEISAEFSEVVRPGFLI